jgi:ABC-type multidrug transport system fused ATPase/permease subunit
VGTVVAVTMLALRLDGPLKMIMYVLTDVQQGMAALARVEGVAAIDVEERRAHPAGREVVLDRVSFGYPGGPDVLHDVTLRPPPGRKTAVVGASGSGKTTIARLIAGIDRPRTGRVTVGGVDAAAIAPERMGRSVALVTQEQFVFRDTVRNNLLLGRATAADADLVRALDTVSPGFCDRLPAGLDTVLGAEAHELGLAETQLLALARVLLAGPDVVVLDEATAGFESSDSRDLESAMAAAFAGRTVVVIAHHLHVAATADHVVVLDRGSVAEQGTHADLLAWGGRYADLWRAWAGESVATS